MTPSRKQSQKPSAAHSQIQAEFGASVAIQGPRILFGAPSRDSFPLCGGVYVFKKGRRSWAHTALFRPEANPSLSWHRNALAIEGNRQSTWTPV